MRNNELRLFDHFVTVNEQVEVQHARAPANALVFPATTPLYLLQLDGMARARYLWDLLLGRPEQTEYGETRATDSQA